MYRKDENIFVIVVLSTNLREETAKAVSSYFFVFPSAESRTSSRLKSGSRG